MPSTKPSVSIFCVPTEAGTHNSGQASAPSAIINSGLAQQLSSDLGPDVPIQIHGNGPEGIFEGSAAAEHTRWRPSDKIDGVRNLDSTLKVLDHIVNHKPLASGLVDTFSIILGGDCSITPAIFSAFARAHQGKKTGLLYVDGDADLTLPAQTSAEGSSGILDSMVMSHLTHCEGCLEHMKPFCSSSADGSALVTADKVVLFGFDPLQPAPEHWVYLLENGFKCFTRPTVARSPVECASKALEYLNEKVDAVLLHFDVDVIDSGVFPLANYPHYAGLEFEQAIAAIEIFLVHEKVKGVVITEVNPGNDASGEMVRRLVLSLASSIQQRYSRYKTNV